MLLMAALLSGALTVTPTVRADAESRTSVGVEASVLLGESPWSVSASFENGAGESYTNYDYRYGSTTYFIPQARTLGLGVTFAGGGRPWRKDSDGWYRTGAERMQALAGLQGGGRQFTYVGTEGADAATRVLLEGNESTRWFVRPTFHLRLYVIRQASFQIGCGYEFGNSPKSYRGFQMLTGISAHF